MQNFPAHLLARGIYAFEKSLRFSAVIQLELSYSTPFKEFMLNDLTALRKFYSRRRRTKKITLHFFTETKLIQDIEQIQHGKVLNLQT